MTTDDDFFDWISYKHCKKHIITTRSREHWREICPRKISTYLSSTGYSNSDIILAFEIIEDLMLEVESQCLPRDVMSEFVCILGFLVKCAQMEEINVRRRAQMLFTHLLANFEPVAQQLLLCRLFDLICSHRIKVEMEPQVLAWLVDIYRRKLHDSDCHDVFSKESSHFYGQISSIVYADMLAGHYFYVAALLLLADQATSGENLPLLKILKRSILDKFQTQLVDYLRVKSLEKKEKNNNNTEKVSITVQSTVEEPIYVLDLLKFTLAETNEKIKKVIKDL